MATLEHTREEEEFLWHAEMARSLDDFQTAMQNGEIIEEARLRMSSPQCARSRALIEESRALITASRTTRLAAVALRTKPPKPPA